MFPQQVCLDHDIFLKPPRVMLRTFYGPMLPVMRDWRFLGIFRVQNVVLMYFNRVYAISDTSSFHYFCLFYCIRFEQPITGKNYKKL
jgi:hypothetical protein